jgi:hypothetical protein
MPSSEILERKSPLHSAPPLGRCPPAIRDSHGHPPRQDCRWRKLNGTSTGATGRSKSGQHTGTLKRCLLSTSRPQSARPPAAQHACELLDVPDVAASLLELPSDEIQAVTVVGVLRPGVQQTFRPAVSRIAAQHHVSATVRLSDGSATVRFSHPLSARGQERSRTATT